MRKGRDTSADGKSVRDTINAGSMGKSPRFRRSVADTLKPIIAAEAKERQREAGGAVIQKSGEAPIRTDKELAKVAGVSHDTIQNGAI